MNVRNIFSSRARAPLTHDLADSSPSAPDQNEHPKFGDVFSKITHLFWKMVNLVNQTTSFFLYIKPCHCQQTTVDTGLTVLCTGRSLDQSLNNFKMHHKIISVVPYLQCYFYLFIIITHQVLKSEYPGGTKWIPWLLISDAMAPCSSSATMVLIMGDTRMESSECWEITENSSTFQFSLQ